MPVSCDVCGGGVNGSAFVRKCSLCLVFSLLLFLLFLFHHENVVLEGASSVGRDEWSNVCYVHGQVGLRLAKQVSSD